MPDEKEKKAKDLYMQFQLVDQQIKQMQKQLEMVTHQLIELDSTSSSLDEFGRIQSGKEILVPMSSGIFAKANVKDTSELLVNVGANVVVKKDISSTKRLIQKQVEEVRKMQRQMMDELEKMTSQAVQIESQLQGIIAEG